VDNSENKSCGNIFSLKNIFKCFGYLLLLVLVINAINAALSEPLKAIVGLLCGNRVSALVNTSKAKQII